MVANTDYFVKMSDGKQKAQSEITIQGDAGFQGKCVLLVLTEWKESVK